MRSIRDIQSGGGNDAKVGGSAHSGDITSKYDGMSENELMSALMRNVAESKSDGSFSESQLDEFVAFVSPSLDESSRMRLVELVNMIKGG